MGKRECDEKEWASQQVYKQKHGQAKTLPSNIMTMQENKEKLGDNKKKRRQKNE